MKEISILGLNLRDHTLRETMRLIDGYLRDGVLNTVECVSAQTLMQAGEDEEQRAWLEAMDLIVFCDTDIVRAAGITARSRFKEIENHYVLREFLKKLAREKYRVYLLSDTQESMAALEEGLDKLPEAVQISGRNVLLEEGTADDDRIINEINDKTPDVVLTLFDYPAAERFLYQNKRKINADVWFNLQKDSLIPVEEEKGWNALLKKVQRKLFQHKVHQYESQEKAEP